MSRNNKKLAFLTLVSIQSASVLMAGMSSVNSVGVNRLTSLRGNVPNQELGEMPGIVMPAGVTQVLADHATRHAAHATTHAAQAQLLAKDAADHATLVQAVATHVAATQTAEQAEKEQLDEAVNVVIKYVNSPNSKNGTLKPGVPGATYQDYRKASDLIKSHAHESLEYALDGLFEAKIVLDVLPKVTVEDQTIQAELNMAINALKAILKK